MGMVPMCRYNNVIAAKEFCFSWITRGKIKRFPILPISKQVPDFSSDVYVFI